MCSVIFPFDIKRLEYNYRLFEGLLNTLLNANEEYLQMVIRDMSGEHAESLDLIEHYTNLVDRCRDEVQCLCHGFLVNLYRNDFSVLYVKPIGDDIMITMEHYHDTEDRSFYP